MTPQFHVMQPTPYGWRPNFFGPYSEGEAYRVMAGLVRLAPGRVFEVRSAGNPAGWHRGGISSAQFQERDEA